jgi:MinD-like ATPase involved in chromosome partitioning or flagellar assembly
LAAEDRLALGLTASHLSYLVIGSLMGYATLASNLPGLLKYPFGLLSISVGIALAWGRLGQRPLDTWVWLAARYYMRPRRSPAPTTISGALVMSAGTEDPPEPEATPAALAQKPEIAPGIAPEIARESARESAPRIAPETAEPGTGESVSSSESKTTADEDDGPRILTLPSHSSQVAEGTTAYRVATGTEVEPEPLEGEPQPPEAAPVFLAATQRIAFFSLKGGVGKTTLATEVAAHLARRGRYRSRPGAAAEPLRVALLDLDLGSANVSMKLGLTHPTLWDLVLDPEPDAGRIEECLVLHEQSGLRVLLGPPRAIAAGEARALAMVRLAQVLKHLDEDGYHFVFLDLSSDIDELTTYALEAAHQVYYVIAPTASGVQDTYRGVETLRRLGHRRKLRFVLNQRRAGFDADEKAIGALAASIYPTLDSVPARAGFWTRLRSRLG